MDVNVSSYPSENMVSSAQINALPNLDGSLAYLSCTRSLNELQKSEKVELRNVIDGYRIIGPCFDVIDNFGPKIRTSSGYSLMYGRVFLLGKRVEALYAGRLSPITQVLLTCVSDKRLYNGGTLTAILQRDSGRLFTEGIYSTDEAMLGLRGLWNFRSDPREAIQSTSGISEDMDLSGQLSIGAEVYYGALHKSGGVSTGLRYTTLRSQSKTPITMTMTLNPLMGHFSATYANKATRDTSLCSRINFNLFSYQSDLTLGCELWQRDGEEITGVLKARIDSNMNTGLAWEGRMKKVLINFGVSMDLANHKSPFGNVGLEIRYMS
ncbi:Mitochondrial distribution and morphology protein 10 [Neolecta irregularis DAH-3]|uniref:Mitochondrial distribution and morphology protein 10 n=1 Tax=Neolecta irregularis (strain DAH-3) TaxID=1198029 RepID=A0A1U7LKS4_NEOID|nr:Mitochondrial distribution and morphology protein 10 [Neolecta irregularis DAH-3]|eukprot:OLL23142.1 Mitochondrial distribution and morphology protein 10 [Neolecta irregularis DAH-3]